MQKKLSKNCKNLLMPIKNNDLNESCASQMTNTFRIIGGEHRGRKFSFADVDGLRPTPNKVCETLFNWLQFEVYGKTFLDLFSGSGALSLEAISRGAKHISSVEKNADAVAFLEQNKYVLKADNLNIIHQDAFIFLNKNSAQVFDFVLLDPPFYKGYLKKALKLIVKNGFITHGSKIYVESEFEITPDFLAANLTKTVKINKQKKSGAVHYCLIQL